MSEGLWAVLFGIQGWVARQESAEAPPPHTCGLFPGGAMQRGALSLRPIAGARCSCTQPHEASVEGAWAFGRRRLTTGVMLCYELCCCFPYFESVSSNAFK